MQVLFLWLYFNTVATTCYKTIALPVKEVLFKERKSKFFGYALPIASENEIKLLLTELKRKHPNANHICYAWRLGLKEQKYRVSDDGEPKNTAGMPIYGQILSYGITNVLIAVVRIFGGTKLGVSGLINAYRATAKLVLERSTIVDAYTTVTLTIEFDYAQMETVMRILKKEDVLLNSSKSDLRCTLVITLREHKAGEVMAALKAIPGLQLGGEVF